VGTWSLMNSTQSVLQAGSSGGKKGEDVKGAMLKPSSVNSPWVRPLHVMQLRLDPAPPLLCRLLHSCRRTSLWPAHRCKSQRLLLDCKLLAKLCAKCLHAFEAGSFLIWRDSFCCDWSLLQRHVVRQCARVVEINRGSVGSIQRQRLRPMLIPSNPRPMGDVGS
jgi:hypothetical protein